MANPFFNTAYYYQNNKDVYASGMDAYAHYLEYGAVEALEGAAGRKPAPWFDIDFYYENNPDLIAAKLTAPELFQHFTTYGYKEGRAPNAAAEQNVNADSLLAYALANPDLLEAFGIEADATELTDAQFADLSFQYFAYGYNEDRPALPDTEIGEVAADQYLTVGKDNILVEGNDNTVYAPVEQNFLGAVTNTLESGDVINGTEGATGNTLVADLTLGVSGSMPIAPAISAETNNIDNVVLRAQSINLDLGAQQGNISHIDAEKFNGVKEWWSDNSRATIQIEDVRTAPEDTLIGLKNSDPDVGFNVYFDPQQLQAGQVASNSQLTLMIADSNKPGSLVDVPVDGLSFKLADESYTVQSKEMGEAKDYDEFVSALEAALAEVEGLEGVTVTQNANNSITLTDPEGKEFAIGGWKFINDEVPAKGTITYDQTVGAPVIDDELITTTVALDNVGRTSEGGAVDVGSLGDGGVEQFDVQVGATSWVSSLESNSYLGLGGAFLEVVNVAHAEDANGDLTIGTATSPSTDDRVVNGLKDVRELNAENFAGDIKAGITLGNNVIGRYLDDAEGTVDFNYNTGSGDDNLTLNVANTLTQDADFALNVDLGAGDDRLNLGLNGGKSNQVSVDGGEGNNTIEVNSSHGTTADTTFKDFANFQNYVVAGTSTTVQNFDSMEGVENVVVATQGLANTTLNNLEAETSVSVNGKNQTLGNASNANQSFGSINVVNAAAAELAINLDNTARIDGQLKVNSLNIDNEIGQKLADTTTRTLDLASNGVRNTANEVTAINAQFVNTFNITGTQDLTTTINSAANSTAAARANFAVDASELDANVDLTVNSNIVAAVTGADKNVTLTGAEGAGDVLTFKGASIATKELTTVSGFETVNFDLTGGGAFNAVKTTGVEQYNIQKTGVALGLTNLSNDVNVDIATAAVAAEVTLRGEGANINVGLSSAANTAGLIAEWTDGTGELVIGGYKTINLDLNNTSIASAQQSYNFDLLMVDSAGLVQGDANYLTGGATVAARELVLTGGRAETENGITSDGVTLNGLSTSFNTIDLTGYAGQVTGSIDDVVAETFISDITVKVGAWNIDWTVAPKVAVEYNTKFVFTDSLKNSNGDVSTWVINDFIDPASGGVDSKTTLDISALGISDLTGLSITDDGVNTTTIVADIPATEQTWEIELTGVLAADVTSDSFIFA